MRASRRSASRETARDTVKIIAIVNSVAVPLKAQDSPA